MRSRTQVGVRGYCRWTPVEPAGTCPDYKSSKLDGSGDPWTTGAGDERSAIGGGSLALDGGGTAMQIIKSTS